MTRLPWSCAPHPGAVYVIVEHLPTGRLYAACVGADDVAGLRNAGIPPATWVCAEVAIDLGVPMDEVMVVRVREISGVGR